MKSYPTLAEAKELAAKQFDAQPGTVEIQYKITGGVLVWIGRDLEAFENSRFNK